MIKISRRAAAVGAAVLALSAGCATWSAAAASAAQVKPATTDAVARCAPGQLNVWVSADSAHWAGGTTTYHLDVTNAGSVPCYLTGWPGAVAANGAGKQFGVPAIRKADVPARIVNIPSSGTAHAMLGYVGAQVNARCKPAAATFLTVFPPDTKGTRRAYFPLNVCTTMTADLTIGRVQAGV